MQIVHPTYVHPKFTQKFLFRCISWWLKTKSKMPNYFAFIFVAIQKRTGCLWVCLFELQQQQKSKQENFVFRIRFSVAGRCNEINIRTKKMKTCPCFSSFPSTHLHTSVLVSKCWLVLESRYIRHVSMQQAWSLVWPHIFVKFYRTILYDQNQKVPW